MKTWVKSLLIIFLVLFGLSAGLVFYVYQNIDGLKQYALKEVNHQLRGELQSKAIDVSVFSTWPHVSLAFQEMSIADPIRPGKKVLKAQNLYLGFNLLDILRNHYKIQLIKIDSGSAYLMIDPAGRTNFDLIRKDNQEAVQSPFHFELNLLELKRMQVTYVDRRTLFEISTFIKETEFSGDFSDSLFSMKVKLDAVCERLQSGKAILIKGKSIGWNGKIVVDRKKNSYHMEKGNLKIDHLQLDCKGHYTGSEKKSKIDVQFDASKLDIQELLSSLPFELNEKFYRYKSSGKVYFKGRYAGTFSRLEQPRLNIDFGIVEGRLTEPESGMNLEKIQLTGSFQNGPKRGLSGAELQVTDLYATLQGSEIKGDLRLKDLENPSVDFNLSGSADLGSLHKFFNWEDVTEVTGNAKVEVHLKGSQKDHRWNWSDPQNKGSFEIAVPALRLSYLNKEISNLIGKGYLDRDRLQIQSASCSIGNSQLHWRGQFTSFLDVLLKPGSPLSGKIILNCPNLNTQDVFIYNSADPHESDELPLNYRFEMELNAGILKYDGFEARQVSTKLLLENNRVDFSDTRFNACGGEVSLYGSWVETKSGPVLKVNSTMSQVNIQSLFSQFENFGQKEITSAHLKGLLKAKSDLRMEFDTQLNVIPSSILLVSDMSIRNGELVNYEPLNALSKFVDVNELRNLKFSELKNTLTIRGEVITIPAMDIRNNALNLNLAGTHTFANVVDYKVKLSLSELLRKKRVPKPNTFEEEDEDTKGVNLYLSVKGPVGKLNYTFDRREVKEKLSQDIKQEGKTIRELLKQELGIKKDSSFKKLEKKNDNPDELEFEQE